MTMSDAVSAIALLVLSAIALVLLFQYLRLREIWQMVVACRITTRWARIWEQENKELRSALRAEKANVEQLERKLVLLQALVPA